MKIYCDKCREEISGEVDIKFDKLQVGHVICPKCHKENKRYLSETDMLLYLGVSETFYLILSILTALVMNAFKFGYITIISIIVLLILAFIIQRQIDRYIYEKAYCKQDIKYIELNENKDIISKSLAWQSMLFMVLVFAFLTINEAKWFFLVISIAAIILTFVKFYLSLKKEKNREQ